MQSTDVGAAQLSHCDTSIGGVQSTDVGTATYGRGFPRNRGKVLTCGRGASSVVLIDTDDADSAVHGPGEGKDYAVKNDRVTPARG